MTNFDELPEIVDLKWLALQGIETRRDIRAISDSNKAMRNDMDMLIRIATRLDTSVNALREDIQTLWLSHGDLRRRLEALETSRA